MAIRIPITQGLLALLLLLTAACREDEYITVMTEQETGGEANHDNIVGLYLLNEGNMGSNKCTLDYLDLSSDSVSHYYRNIFAERNPGTVLELGDVGNDIAIYGSKLWMVINCSNKVEVCEALTTKRLGQIEIANARYLASDGPFAYVSSYAGPVQINENSPLGRVYKVDTLTLQKVDSLTVGFQPEEMAISRGKLYVANSGGYRVPKYDNRLAVIDLQKFTVLDYITLGINLHRVVADRLGQIWVSSRGDYYSQPPALYCIGEEGKTEKLDIPVTALSLVGDSLFYIGSSFNYATGKNDKCFGVIDIKTHQEIETHLFDAPEIQSMQLPYSILVNPYQRDFYLMDARNYVSSGQLLHIKADGTFDWKVWTGDIPSRGCFLMQNNKQ